METKIFYSAENEAAEIIKNGGLVAVPTETVYGLAANGLNEAAVKQIYEVKGRPAVKPLSLMVQGAEAMDEYCEDVPQAARKLAEKFWPGPLTIVLKAKKNIPDIVLAGGDTVGLRCPMHEMTLELLKKSGCPFAAPSANPSGEESPKSAEKVIEYFNGKIDAVIDGGVCNLGKESTIIDMTHTPYKILRVGALAEDEIADALLEDVFLVGITGGTGSGKSTALAVLREKGALMLDADKVYHYLLENSSEMMQELSDRYPGTVIDGVLDRPALSRIVFNDEEALKDLNRITHRYVDIECTRRLREHAMAGGKLASLDAIELLGCETGRNSNITVAVVAPKDRRVERIMARDGISREMAVMRIEAQKPDEYFIENCNYTLMNDGTAEEFNDKCRKFFEEVLPNG